MCRVKSRALRHPYLILSVLIVLLALAFSIRRPWSGDLGMHGATIERLRLNLTHPGNPLVDADTPSPYYSPYTVLLAVVARLFGWSALTVLNVVSPINVVVLLIGVRAFIRTLTDRAWAPVLAIVSMLLLWGLQPWVWSGFLSFWALPLVMSYPSTIALGLTLLWWTGLSRSLDAPARWYRYLGLGLLAAVIALTHQFTFVIAALGAVALVVSKARTLSRAAWLFLILAAAEAVVLILIWPYYSFFDLSSVSGSLDNIHRPLYANPFMRYGLCVVALPALWLRVRRNRLDPLVLLFGMSALVVVGGWVTGKYEYGRVWPGVMLAAQLALAVELAGPLPVSRWVRRAWLPVTALACAIGLVTQVGNLVYLAPASLATGKVRGAVNAYVKFPDYSWIRRYVHEGDVVLTDDYFSLHAIPGYGVFTVQPAWPDPMLPDESARRAAEHEMVTTKDPARRAELFRQYHVRWVLEVPGKWTIATGQAPVAFGPYGQRLYRVNPAGQIAEQGAG
jgi:hypothetical protein